MTRKDYERIAAIIRRERSLEDSVMNTDGEQHAIRSTCSFIAQQLADVFEDDNPRFDRDRFLDACGVT